MAQQKLGPFIFRTAMKLRPLNIALARRVPVLVLCLSLAPTIAGHSAQNSSSPEWYQLKVSDGGFSIKFPTKPSYKLDSIPIANIEIPMHRYILSIESDYYFEVSYVDFPAGFSNQAGGFDGGVSGLSRSLTSNGGRVLSRTTIAHRGCEGREVVGTEPRAALVRARFFQSGQRFYNIAFFAKSDAKDSRDVSRYFFDSFEVVDKCTGGLAPMEAPSTDIKTSFVEGVTDPTTGWRKIASEQDAFSVLMPTRAKVEEQEVRVKPFPLSSRTYESAAGGALYTVVVTGDYPDSFYSEKNSFQVQLDVAQAAFQGQIAEYSARATFVRNLSVGPFPGREYMITSDKRTGREQIFVTTRKTYWIMAFDDVNTHSASNFDKFFGSVRISAK